MVRTRETRLKGEVLCSALIKYSMHKEVKLIKTEIEVPATYTECWECDGGFLHDEGEFDFDINEAKVVYDKEFEIVGLYSTKQATSGKIVAILNVYDSSLNEV